MRLTKILQKKYKIILILIFFAALILRWWFLPQKAVSFAFDQGRDAFIAGQIAAGDLKIQGPSSSTPGLYHGVLYYYVIAPAYMIGSGDPVVAAGFLSLISSLGVFAVFWLARLLTKDVVPSLFSALIFAASYESVQYSNFLSNASIGLWFVPLIYIGLYMWLSGKKYGSVICGISLGLATQSLITLIYHSVPVAFWLIVFRKKIKLQELLWFVMGFLIATSTMIFTQLRMGAKSFESLLFLLTGKDEITQGRTLEQFISVYISQVSTSFNRTLFPTNSFIGTFIGWLMVLVSLYKKDFKNGKMPSWQFFLATFVLSHVSALIFGGLNMRHILVGVSSGISVMAGIFIWSYFKNKSILMYGILLVILISNINQTLKTGKGGQVIFPHQLDLVLSKELELIDFTYEKTGGKPFSISTLTSPLFINTTWSYLYNWYGSSKYGHLPMWKGRDQVGQLGNNLEKTPVFLENHFFIKEPEFGIPDKYVEYAFGEQNSGTGVVSEKFFGELVVQQRKPN